MADIIEKPAVIDPPPNLRDYDAMFGTFKWQDAYDRIEWFEDGTLNAAASAVDRHAESSRKNKVAMYWEGESAEKYTFLELSSLSNRFANVLTDIGIERRDRVFIFLPRVPELYVSFLGILKTGAIAGTMFSAFGPEGLYDRLHDSGARYLITNSKLLERVQGIRDDLPDLERVILVDGTDHSGTANAADASDAANAANAADVAENDVIYSEAIASASRKFDVARMSPDDPAFMLYTSGTTGKPKGVCTGTLRSRSSMQRPSGCSICTRRTSTGVRQTRAGSLESRTGCWVPGRAAPRSWFTTAGSTQTSGTR